jgi:hypothetical protein
MKKSILLLGLFAAGLTLFFGCTDDAEATLSIKNDLGIDVSLFELIGEEDTGNLLPEGTILNVTSVQEFVDLLPGKYEWRVEYTNSLMLDFKSPVIVELYPGPNHLALIQ